MIQRYVEGVKVDVEEATFHQWTIDSQLVDNIPMHHTLAIVELRNGSVELINYDYIRFIRPAHVRNSYVQIKT
jgi:hypothetical protein